MDSVSEARLQLVDPVLSNKIYQLATMLETENIIFRVTQGLRTWADQQVLYAQGRTTPGKIVTNAPPGYSYHQFGLAVDIVPMDQDPPQPDWNITHPIWQRIIVVSESLGLVSGSCFSTIKDWPHLQYTGGVFPESPDDELRQILQNQGIETIWQELNNKLQGLT
jgi:peptidoglycan LD-endopeptidase CwlK